MSEPLHRLIYRSRNRAPADGDVAREIEAILAVSQRNNARDGITGALLFNRGVFAQVLEGERGALERAFERIQCDDRHGEVAVLAFGEVEGRRFPTWSMGYVGRSAGDRALFDDVAGRTGFAAESLRAERVLALILELALEEEALVRGKA